MSGGASAGLSGGGSSAVGKGGKKLSPDMLGEPRIQTTLNAGDLLYLPRGYVHQAMATQADSLHVTASLGRQHTWRDLLEFGLFGAL